MPGTLFHLPGDGRELQYPNHLDRPWATNGIDDLRGTNQDDVFWTGDGADLIDGRSGPDIIHGADGDDVIEGGVIDAETADSADQLFGDDGNDTITGRWHDKIDGGAGQDRVTLLLNSSNFSYTLDMALMYSKASVFDLGDGTSVFRVERYDELRLGSGADTVTGSFRDERVRGGSGNDSLAGADGNDTLFGDAGSDTLSGGDGNDVLDSGAFEPVGNILDGGVGDDLVTVNPKDQADGGIGFDTIILNLAATDDTLDLAQIVTGGSFALADGTSFTGIEAVREVFGGRGHDVIQGTAAAEILHGNENRDTLYGLGGDDILTGELADDLLYGGQGGDQLSGGELNDQLDGGEGADRMVGGTGNDTYQVDNAGDLVEETGTGDGNYDTVYSTVSFVSPALIERIVLLGTGDIDGIGNDLANRIDGSGGDNSLEGRAGDDLLWGAAGDDLLFGGDGNDRLEGRDHQDTLHGEANDDTLIGGKGDDSLYGGDGNDLLAGGDGADRMEGGSGNDTYLVDSDADIVVEDGGGDDLVEASVSWTLGAGIERLTLTSKASLKGVGNELDNLLTGNDGNNFLDGKEGADTMVGGKGDDTYRLAHAGDQAVELADGGTDTVLVRTSFSLVGTAIENITIEGTTAAVTLTGNDARNILIAGAGDDTLNGGTGVDRLEGGAGFDTYYVDDSSDRVVDSAGGGRIISTVSFDLGTVTGSIDKLLLWGSDNISATGKAAAETLSGNAGNNSIDGKGGADRMIGGAGDDTYFVDDAGDTVVELDGQGTDTVRSWLSFSLEGGFAENVTLEGGASSNATGNALANRLSGTTGINTLVGGGGDDWLDGRHNSDVLTGGSGHDTFAFTAAFSSGIDTITDFTVGEDLIFLAPSAGFPSPGAGPMPPSWFGYGLANQDASDRFIYEPTTGYLYYDTGLGGTAPLHFATLPANLAIDSTSFVMGPG